MTFCLVLQLRAQLAEFVFRWSLFLSSNLKSRLDIFFCRSIPFLSCSHRLLVWSDSRAEDYIILYEHLSSVLGTTGCIDLCFAFPYLKLLILVFSWSLAVSTVQCDYHYPLFILSLKRGYQTSHWKCLLLHASHPGMRTPPCSSEFRGVSLPALFPSEGGRLSNRNGAKVAFRHLQLWIEKNQTWE